MASKYRITTDDGGVYEITTDEPSSPAEAFWNGLKSSPIAHPLDTAASMYQSVRHPGNTLNAIEQGREQTVDRAIDSFKKGNYTQGAIHGALSLIPAIGPQLSEHYQEMRDAQDRGDDAAEAAAAGKMIGLAGSVEAGRWLPEAVKAAPKVAAATGEAAANAATFTGAAAKAGGADLAIGATKTAAGLATAKTGSVAAELGLGAPLVAKGATQMARGARAGFVAGKQAVVDRLAALKDAAAQPTQPEVIPPARQLPAGPIVTPAPADTSGPIPGWQPAQSPAVTAGPVKMPRPAAADFSWPGEMGGPVEPAGEVRMPESEPPAREVSPAEREASARTKKARALAQVLNQNGVAAGDLQNALGDKDMAPVAKAHLSDLVKSLKINQTGQLSPASIDETLFELRKLERANAKQTGTGEAGQGVSPSESDQPGGHSSPSATEVPIPGEPTVYPAEYNVRELSDVQPSHNGLTFQPNPKYPYLNDRDYTKAENQGKVLNNAMPAKFNPAYHISDNPDATNGPPVVDNEGNALGGNGRTMIMQRVYATNPAGAKAYRDMLIKRAPQFGLDPADVQKMKQPILVREVSDEDLANAQNAITDFNKKPTAELRPSERAIADSRRVSQDTLDHIADRLDQAGPDATLAKVLEGAGGADVLDKLIGDNVISPQERAAYADRNGLTAEGRARISKLLVGRFFRDPSQLDRIPVMVRNKLERLAAPLARVEAEGEWNLTPRIQEAMDLLEDAGAYGTRNLDEFIKQSGLLGDQAYSPQAVTLAKRLQNWKTADLTYGMKKYVQDAQQASKGTDMFGNEPPTQGPSFDEAFSKPRERRIRKPQPAMAQ